MVATAALAPEVGIAAVCHALGLARASVYRRISPPAPKAKRERPSPARALTPTERQAVLQHRPCPGSSGQEKGKAGKL